MLTLGGTQSNETTLRSDFRADFPAFHAQAGERPVAYLDTAATSQLPWRVIDAISAAYAGGVGNIHRGVHEWSVRSTEAYEASRAEVARFIGADSPDEIVFTRGATESVNLVASSFVAPRWTPESEIVVSAMEHHANIVPWQQIVAARGGRLRVIPMDRDGNLVLDGLDQLLGPNVALLAVTHVSNALGTVNPVDRLIAAARARGIPTLIDGAQAVGHMPVDVARLGADFYVFSGHKVFAPTGIGVLYGSRERLTEMPPWQGGGDMIRRVTWEKTEFADAPARFEAGTPNIVGAIALGEALRWLANAGWNRLMSHEAALTRRLVDGLRTVPGVRLVGNPARRAGVVSFVTEEAHPHDVGTLLDQQGVAVRVGHHCAQPVMDFFGIPGTVRASVGPYNTGEDVDRLIEGLRRVREVFA